MEITNVINDTNNSGLLTLAAQIHDVPKTPLNHLQGSNIREVEYNDVYHMCDILKITHLVFYSQLNLEEFKNTIKEYTFQIIIYNEVFLKIPLKFLIYLNNIVQSNNNDDTAIQKYYINFPDFLFEFVSVAIVGECFKIS